MEPAYVDRGRTRVALTVALLACVVVVGASTIHRRPSYLMVDELVSQRLLLERGREVRVHGFVQAGTIERDAGMVRFVLTRNGVSLRIQLRDSLPDPFRDQSEVVVRGRLVTDEGGWRLDATDLMARCATRYGDDAPPDKLFK